MISTNQSTAPTDLDQLEWTVGEVADIEDILAKLSTLFWSLLYLLQGYADYKPVLYYNILMVFYFILDNTKHTVCWCF